MIRIVLKGDRYWFQVAGVLCVRSYPQAMKLLKGEA
jgi:hypothetical protein